MLIDQVIILFKSMKYYDHEFLNLNSELFIIFNNS